MIAFLGCKLAISEELVINYQISPSYTLPQQSNKISEWLPPQLISSKDKVSLLALSDGKIFQRKNNVVNTDSFIDLSLIFPTTSQLKLTAFTLHPNFSRTDKTGEGILYTAHREYFLGLSSLALNDIATPEDQKLNYYTVIIEWQLNQDKGVYHYSGSPREILRISLPDSHKGITQLGFNPHLKPWHTDFGLLHAVLPEDKKTAHIPLYSGSVLRINPARFGLKNYTVPASNTFLKKHKILNEIVLFGAQDIQQINWTKHDYKKIIVSHLFSNNAQVSYGKLGNNWLKETPSKVLWALKNHSNPLSASLFDINKKEYLGVLYKIKNSWEIANLNLSELSNNANIKSWAMDTKIATPQDSLKLIEHYPLRSDIYNASTQKTFTIEASIETPSSEHTSLNESTKPINYVLIALLFISLSIVGVMSYIVYWVYTRYNGVNVKPVIRKNLSNFSCTNNKLKLYKRGSASPCNNFNIEDILSTEILLNDALISKFSADELFDTKMEQSLLKYFSIEQQYKMTSHKVRKVMMILTDKKNNTYSICLYLRKGDQRYTKLSYELTQTKLIEWGQLYTSAHSTPT